MAGEGLAVDYTFSRQPFSGDPHMVSVHIHFSNSSDTPIKGLHVGTPKLPPGISIQEFPEIGAEISTLRRVVEEAPGRGREWEGPRVCLWLLTVHSVPSQGLGSGSTQMASAASHALVDKTN